jgi:hypothetical protein
MFSIDATQIPEPATIAVATMAFAFMAVYRRRRAKGSADNLKRRAIRRVTPPDRVV